MQLNAGLFHKRDAKGMFAGAKGMAGAVRQDKLCRAVGGNRKGKAVLLFVLFPSAFDGAEKAFVRCFCKGKMSAGERGEPKMIFSVHLNSAHSTEQPFTDGTFGIVV